MWGMCGEYKRKCNMYIIWRGNDLDKNWADEYVSKQ